MKLQEVQVEKIIVEGVELSLLTETHQTPAQKHNEMLMERFAGSDVGVLDNTVDEVEEAYDQIALLNRALDEKNFGLIIGKRGKLVYNDIREIKRELAKIIRSNVLIDGGDIKRGRDGDEKLRIMVRSIGHSLEMLALGATTIALGGLAGAGVATGVGAIAAGTAAVGTGALAINQAKIISDLRALNKLLTIVDQYAELKPKIDVSRGKLKRFWDYMTRKSPEAIERAAESKIRAATKKQQMKMQKLLRGFPKYITYHDEDGEQEYPIVSLFDNI